MPGALSQANRLLKITTPLGADDLLLVNFSGREAISELFQFQAQVLAANGTTVAFEKLLVQPVTVELNQLAGTPRFFHGIVQRVTEGERDADFTEYTLDIVPRFWVLTRTYRSRIFQHLNVPDILKKVLAGLDVKFEIQGTFHPRRFVAQYRETDFAFASRLMEEEGIYYYFQHTADGHKMIVANTPYSHVDVPFQPQVTFEDNRGGNRPDLRVRRWSKSQEARSGKVAFWDHCFEMPQKTLEASRTTQDSVAVGKVTHTLKVGGNDKWELYDYPGAYAQRFDGIDRGGSAKPAELTKLFEDNVRTAGIRMQQETLPAVVVRGESNCGQLTAGHKFTLARHVNADGTYVLTAVEHRAVADLDYRSGGPAEGAYSNTFTGIPEALPYRPPQTTPKPVVQGVQTAFVVGPKGEQIFCDKYGRVKVQFHWDREGEENVESSCWLRVSQSWGGGNWGGMNLPHVGQEVIVSFEEGDPDRPIITGRVYNAEKMPPLGLPQYKSKSVLRDHGGNQIIMEGQGGSQQILMHSPHSNTTLSIGSASPAVYRHSGSGSGAGPDDNATLAPSLLTSLDKMYAHNPEVNSQNPTGHFHGGFWLYTDEVWYVHVGNNEFTHVVGDTDRWVSGASHTTLNGPETINVLNTSDIVVKGDATETYHGNMSLTIDKKWTTVVGGDVNETFNSNWSVNVPNGNITIHTPNKVDFQGLSDTSWVKGADASFIWGVDFEMIGLLKEEFLLGPHLEQHVTLHHETTLFHVEEHIGPHVDTGTVSTYRRLKSTEQAVMKTIDAVNTTIGKALKVIGL